MSDGRRRKSADEDVAPRERIIAAGVSLVARQGAGAATTRAIAHEAAVQPPTIFRHFGDKEGLLDAIAERVTSEFLARKLTSYGGDPVENLRTGMEMFMEFGVGHPDIYLHMYARPDRLPKAALRAVDALRQRVREAALTGRLAVSEQRAFDILNSLSRGTVMLMLERDEDERRGMIAGASAAAMTVILTGEGSSPETSPRAAAALLKASLDDLGGMSAGERLLLSELLDRISDAPSG